jgi:hypothetical protein
MDTRTVTPEAARTWLIRGTHVIRRWETLFDQAVGLAQDGCTSETLSILKRIRSWQHRQSRHGKENHNWHDAELLWLQGVILERAGQSSDAAVVWGRLARVYKEIARLGDSSFLPRCARCAERVLQFAPSWFAVAAQLRDRAGDQDVEDACGGLLNTSTSHLFRPFEQRGADRTGVGLGLAFCRWAVEANDGRIYARNRRVPVACLLSIFLGFGLSSSRQCRRHWCPAL